MRFHFRFDLTVVVHHGRTGKLVSELQTQNIKQQTQPPLRFAMDLASSSSSTCNGDCKWRDDWDVSGTVAWVKSRGSTRVTLQFPDELLQESTLVAAAIQRDCTETGLAVQVSEQSDPVDL